MASRKDDPFEPKLSPPRSRGPGGSRFLSRVLKATWQAGHVARGGIAATRGTRGAMRGRGFVAAKMAGRGLVASSRRVTVKTRLVNLRKVGAKSSAMHLKYVEREGVTPTGEPARAYGAVTDEADTEEFLGRGLKDRHQFRFIVSAEDAAEFGDLKPFTRAFMGRMETDLGTHLDWVAVDHFDTGHPHTHIVLRGKEQGGQNLVIARDYISHGMRSRASEIATEWLGPRTEREIEASLTREVTQDRWTSLDAAIERESSAGFVDLGSVSWDPELPMSRSFMVGRLNTLARMGLAEERGPGIWSLSSDFPETLRSMGERGDIIRTMQRAMSEAREYRVFDPARETQPVTGRIIAKGLHGEMHAQGYLILDGLDGRAHYAALAVEVDIGSLPVGAIVKIRVAEIRAADRTIGALAKDGIYRSEDHLRQLHKNGALALNAEAVVQAHVRRLEALRRDGLVDRLSDGVWRVPSDLPEGARKVDLKRLGGATVDIRCHLPIERQINAIGATWLDRELIKGSTEVPNTEFGAGIRQALKAREDFLETQGLARRVGTQVTLVPKLLATLRDREIAEQAARIEATTHLLHRPALDGIRVSGTYRESIQLTSGRFAMLDDGVGFSLVPWRPVIEHRLGQNLSALVDGARVNWAFGRSRSRSL